MKQLLLISAAVIISMIGCNQANKVEDVPITTNNDSVSYAIGIDIGRSLKKQDIEIEPSFVLEGMVNALDENSKLTDEELANIMQNFQKELREKMMKKNAELSEKNKAEAEAFFAENKKKEGVITLDNGIQYKILKKGNGKSPKLSNTVETHYRGRLIDGTEFDSSYKHGKPYTTKITNVIRGWTEILQIMKEGDKWEVYIPSDLAYGPRGSGQIIGPDAALIFELELISVK